MKDIYALLTALTDQFEVVVRPFDNKWEAIVTNYNGGGTIRRVGSSAREALQLVLEAIPS